MKSDYKTQKIVDNNDNSRTFCLGSSIFMQICLIGRSLSAAVSRFVLISRTKNKTNIVALIREKSLGQNALFHLYIMLKP